MTQEIKTAEWKAYYAAKSVQFRAGLECETDAGFRVAALNEALMFFEREQRIWKSRTKAAPDADILLQCQICGQYALDHIQAWTLLHNVMVRELSAALTLAREVA